MLILETGFSRWESVFTDDVRVLNMTGSPDLSEEEIREMDKKEFRKNFPSGWMEVSRYETLVLVIDALLETPAYREFTVKELADKAGSTKKSVERRIPSLVQLGIIEELQKEREETRYTLNSRSPITQKLYELNDTVNRVKEGELPTTVVREPSEQSVNDPTKNKPSSRFEGNIGESNTEHSGGRFTLREGALG